MIIATGKVIVVRPQVIDTKGGKSFTINRVHVMNGGDPYCVKFGDKVSCPKVGDDIRQPVFVRAFSLRSGGTGYDLNAYNAQEDSGQVSGKKKGVDI